MTQEVEDRLPSIMVVIPTIMIVLGCVAHILMDNDSHEREKQKVLCDVAAYLGQESEVFVVEMHAQSTTNILYLLDNPTTHERMACLVPMGTSPLPASGETWFVEPAFYHDCVYRPMVTFVRRVR